MVVGMMRWDLALPGVASLKDKRMVVRSLKDRIRHRFRVSVAETAQQDQRARAQIAVALVATDGRHAEEVLDKVDRLVAQEARALVLDRLRELY